MNVLDIIAKKRDGGKLSKDEILFLIEGVVSGSIKDYQAASFLMAAYINGLDQEETIHLTHAMISKEISNVTSRREDIYVDKHSSGGVGDTTTLVVGPILASFGLKVAKTSGRGLGFTGGTVDKLESVPGLNTNLDLSRIQVQLDKCNIAIASQIEELSSSDKILYSLRNSTATVGSIPLIASSIMSKKIAMHPDFLILDIKCGEGAFMKDICKAQELSKLCIAIAKSSGLKSRALITNMNRPLSKACGNAVEVKIAVETLKGKGCSRLKNLSLDLCSHVLVMANIASSLKDGYSLAASKIDNLEAYEVFKKMCVLQGADPRFLDEPDLLLENAVKVDVLSDKTGYVSDISALITAQSVFSAGAGRTNKADDIDIYAGVIFHKAVGEEVVLGEKVAEFYSRSKECSLIGAKNVKEAFTYSQNQPLIEDKLVLEAII